MRKIFVKDLQSGDTLAMPVKLPRTGIALLTEGTVITPKHKDYLIHYGLANEQCYILEINEQEKIVYTQAEKTIVASFRDDIMQSIESLELRRTISSTCVALSNLEKDVKEGKELSLQPLHDASQQLLSHVLQSNAVMLQLAALKVINEYTFSHSVNVAIYAITFGRILGLEPETLKELALSGLLHDIGKINVPIEIIDKPGELTREEFDRVKRHTYEGYKQLVNRTDVSNDVLQTVLQHHERLDGSGYPQQLQSKKIHPWARMLSIIDVYDALTSQRCYRNAVLPHETADYLMGMASQGMLDLDLLSIYLKKMPLYPQGCQVNLSNGQTGMVVAIPVGAPLRPVVEITSVSAGKVVEGYSAVDFPLTANRKRLELDSNHTIFITGLVSR